MYGPGVRVICKVAKGADAVSFHEFLGIEAGTQPDCVALSQPIPCRAVACYSFLIDARAES